jgi:hypothetical protein
VSTCSNHTRQGSKRRLPVRYGASYLSPAPVGCWSPPSFLQRSVLSIRLGEIHGPQWSPKFTFLSPLTPPWVDLLHCTSGNLQDARVAVYCPEPCGWERELVAAFTSASDGVCICCTVGLHGWCHR